MSRYNPETIERLTHVVNEWQNGSTIRGRDALEFNSLVQNVSTDRWNKHFGMSKRDWVDTKCIREEVPLVFLQYLKYRRSVRLAGMRCCPIDNPHYSSLPYTMNVFRRQFPRIVSVLTANHVGVTLLKEYEPRIVPYMVATPVYSELHKALCIMRKIAAETNTRLYGPQRYGLISQTLREMYSSEGKQLPTLLDNRVLQRRTLVVNAANDILTYRSLAHHDARSDGSITDHFDKNNTNFEV